MSIVLFKYNKKFSCLKPTMINSKWNTQTVCRRLKISKKPVIITLKSLTIINRNLSARIFKLNK